MPWTCPKLTKNGTPGGSEYAAYWTGGDVDTNCEAYKAFDGDPSSRTRQGYNGHRLVLYSPYLLNIRGVSMDMTRAGNNEYLTSWRVEYSEDGTSWNTLYKGGNQGMNPTASFTCPGYYHYFAIYQGSVANGSQWGTYWTVDFTGDYKADSSYRPWASSSSSTYFIKY